MFDASNFAFSRFIFTAYSHFTEVAEKHAKGTGKERIKVIEKMEKYSQAR
jgi:hypothetical protein